MLELIGVNKAYDGQPFIRDFSLELAEGEILSLLGPSGCGKTTLLRLIAGLAKVAVDGDWQGRVVEPGHEDAGAELAQTDREGEDGGSRKRPQDAGQIDLAPDPQGPGAQNAGGRALIERHGP